MNLSQDDRNDRSLRQRLTIADGLFASALVLSVGFWIYTRIVNSEAVGPRTVMPTKVRDAEEYALYLVPGGIYTAADIEANGNVTVSQRFEGFVATHDFSPNVGDRLCPITRTKANPECWWVIAGQRYTFCCPPCIDEFLQLAKERPELVLLPEEYVK